MTMSTRWARLFHHCNGTYCIAHIIATRNAIDSVSEDIAGEHVVGVQRLYIVKDGLFFDPTVHSSYRQHPLLRHGDDDRQQIRPFPSYRVIAREERRSSQHFLSLSWGTLRGDTTGRDGYNSFAILAFAATPRGNYIFQSWSLGTYHPHRVPTVAQ